jgi:hypothetical protein
MLLLLWAELVGPGVIGSTTAAVAATQVGMIVGARTRSELKVKQMVQALLLASRFVKGTNFKLIRLAYRHGG